MKIEKTDAHHHLWHLASPHYPMLRAPDAERFIGNTGGLKHDFGAAEFLPLARAQNVTRSVYVESHFDPAIEEVAHVQAFADEHGFPHAIVGRGDLASPEFARVLDVYQRSALFRGVRTMLNWDADPKLRAVSDAALMLRPEWHAGYAEAGSRGLSVEVMVTPAQLAMLADLAASFPATPLIVAHAGLPLHRTPAEKDVWRDGIARLAALPHVAVKISGLAMVDHHWTLESIRPIVEYLIDAFAPERCMFASNFPVDGLHVSYDRLWDAFDTITADSAEADRLALFRDTARRIYAIH